MDNRGEGRKDRRIYRKNEGERGLSRDYTEVGSQRRFERGDGERIEGRREFKSDRPRMDRFAPRRGDLSAIIDMDNEILHLVARRTQMLSRLRRGGRLAPETEKTLRTAWENKAARLSRDRRLSRDLFLLLQNIDPMTRWEEEQGYYNLSPNGEAVDICIPAPSDTVAARCWLAMSAASGQKTAISRVPLTDAVVSAVKALNQIGGMLRWEENGDVQSSLGNGLIRNMDKVIHVGNDAFNLWLIIALCVGMPTRLKLMGDSSLRVLDIAPLRHFLPQIGVRLTNVIPSQDGLPVRMECSGLMPQEVNIADDLPEDFVAAMVLASPFWEAECKIILPKRSIRLLPLVLDVLAGCGVKFSLQGREFSVKRGAVSVPERPVVPMDAFVAATILMLPGFNGGKAELEGVWGRGEAFSLAEKILRGAGLNVKYGANKVICTGKDRETSAPAPEVMADVLEKCPEFLPLCTVIIAAAVHEGTIVSLPELSDEERYIVTAFLSRCGVVEEGGALSAVEDTVPGSWLAPSAHWAMAYALIAFLRPNLHLSNPGVMTNLFPLFWNMYNTLPKPDLKRKKAQENEEDAKPARRRVIAHGVYGELPPEPSSGDDF